MNRQQKQTLIAAASAVLAVICVFAYTASIKSEASTARAAALRAYGGERVQVLVASEDIPVGQTVGSGNVVLQDWIVDLLPQGSVATSVDQVVNKVAQVDIKKNEPVLLDRVGNGSSRISVPDGLEAVAVSSDNVLAVGGAIKAGSFVDVYVETSKGKIAQLGKKILVLDTSSAQDKGDEKISWVTLAVTPDSVSDLIAASCKGTIHLVLPSGNSAQGGEGK